MEKTFACIAGKYFGKGFFGDDHGKVQLIIPPLVPMEEVFVFMFNFS
jgi:hypothetical protein